MRLRVFGVLAPWWLTGALCLAHPENVAAQAEPAQPAPPTAPSATGSAPPSAATQPAAVAALPDAAPDASGWGTAAGLRYLEIVRGDASPNDKLPLLIVLHGLGDKPSHDWLQRVAVNPSVKVRMILPQAPLPFGEGGYGWFPYRAGNLDQVSLAQFVSAAADRVSQLVTTLAQQRPTTGRAVVCGFSQGAILTYALSLRHPDQIELAVPISGMLPAPLWPERGPGDLRFPSVLALHGTSDPVIRFGVDDQLVHRLHALGYRVELKAFTGVGHTMTPDMVELIRANISPALTQQTRTAARGAKPKAR